MEQQPTDNLPAGIDFAADALAIPASDSSLARVSRLTTRQVALEERKKALEAELKAVNIELRQLQFSELPEAMDSVALGAISLTDGLAVKVEDFIECSLAGEDGVKMARAVDWLRRTGQTGAIKAQVTVEFGKGEEARVQAALGILRTAGFAASERATVHTATFKKILRECREEGMAIPTDELGVFIGRRAVIKRP